VSMKFRNESVTPLEPGLVLITSRTEGTSFEQLYNHTRQRLAATQVLKMHRTTVSVGEIVLKKWRMCTSALPEDAGRQSFEGGGTATSGLVAAVLLYELCGKLTMFGIGETNVTGFEVPYQYYTLGNTERNKGNPVHSFTAEERFLKALAYGQLLTFCGLEGCTRGGKVTMKPPLASFPPPPFPQPPMPPIGDVVQPLTTTLPRPMSSSSKSALSKSASTFLAAKPSTSMSTSRASNSASIRLSTPHT